MRWFCLVVLWSEHDHDKVSMHLGSDEGLAEAEEQAEQDLTQADRSPIRAEQGVTWESLGFKKKKRKKA